MQTVKLVMIVKNEARCLKRCMDSVKNLVDGAVVVDTGSTDHTCQIARDCGAQVHQFAWADDFSAARNFALDLSDGDWNLVLDGDEWLASGTRADIQEFLENQRQLGAIQIRNAYQDDGGVSYGLNYTTRLLPRGARFSGKIHEQVQSTLPRYPVALVFEHDGYLQSGKSGRNLPLLLAQLEGAPEDSYYLYHTASALRNLKRWDEALPYYQRFRQTVATTDNYYARGMVAYLYTLLDMAEFAQGLALVEEEMTQLAPYADFWFACGIFYMKLVLSDTESYLPYLSKIEGAYLRCLEIGERPEHGGIWGTGSFKAAYNLGTWYEVSGNATQARRYYLQAGDYPQAKARLAAMG